MYNITDLINRVKTNAPDVKTIEEILRCENRRDLNILFAHADSVRKQYTGDGVLVRALVEFSNACQNTCHYCGLNRTNKTLKRYLMNEEEILSSVESAYAEGMKTVVLQSGEMDNLNPRWLARIISLIKSKYDIAVTLSVGERSREDYELWKRAGADRYLLKIETTDAGLYRRCHSFRSLKTRMRCVDDLIAIGYQTGSGSMVGLPGQTLKMVARDIIYFYEKQFDMIGINPFIPHGATRFRRSKKGDVLLALKVIALTRILTKNAHMPATTALGSISKKVSVDHRLKGLKAGANVIMVNFTPLKYKALYEIYPSKRCLKESGAKCSSCISGKVKSIGRYLDYSIGHSLKQK